MASQFSSVLAPRAESARGHARRSGGRENSAAVRIPPALPVAVFLHAQAWAGLREPLPHRVPAGRQDAPEPRLAVRDNLMSRGKKKDR